MPVTTTAERSYGSRRTVIDSDTDVVDNSATGAPDSDVGEPGSTPIGVVVLPDGLPARTGRTTVSTLHRAIAVLALMSLFVGALGDWSSVVWDHPLATTLIMVAYGLVLVLAILALTVGRRIAMVFVDVGVLAVTLLIRLPAFFGSFPALLPGDSPYPNDEGPLVDMAGKALSHGLDPYNAIWPGPEVPLNGITETMSGGVVNTYDYPPLAAVADYLIRPLTASIPTAAVVAMCGLVLAAIVLFVILPAPWRCAAPMMLFGFDLLPSMARGGYPMVMMLPFLLVAVAGWARIGRPAGGAGSGDGGGGLGVRGWASAICLGVAMGFQPLAWFIAPFLVLGLLVVRAGDLGWWRSWWLAVRYGTVAVGVFLAANLPFAVVDLHSWSHGLLLPLTDALVPHGQGLIDISYYLVGGSGDLGGYSHAAIALLFGLMVISVLFMRRLGPAVVVLPWATFYLATRSQDNYFLVTAPLWIVSLATLRRYDFAHAWQPWRWSSRPARILSSWPVRTVVFIALLAPAGLFTASAATSPQPLQMTIESMTTFHSSGAVALLTVDVVNVSDQTIAPHFALSNNASMSRAFMTLIGPDTLAAGRRATYLIMPFDNSSRSVEDRLMLRAISDKPITISSTPVPGSLGSSVLVPPVAPAPSPHRPRSLRVKTSRCQALLYGLRPTAGRVCAV